MMRAEAALAAMAALPVVSFRAAFGDAPALILAPHPDDESLGCGGLIAEACRQACPPIVVVLTDGTMSHPRSRRFPHSQLGLLREREALAATAHLGLPPERVIFLRYPDTAAPSEGPSLQQAALRLADIVTAHGCGTVIASWEHDPHCDHEAAARIARTACQMTGARQLAYPIWGYTLPPEHPIEQDRVSGFRLNVAHQHERKLAAIMAHRSQYAGLIDDDPDGFQLDTTFIERFLTSTETFIECGGAGK